VTAADVDLIAPAFVAALGELGDVRKSSTANAGTYSYSYADLATVLGSVRPVLAAHGLALYQACEVIGGLARVTTTVLHASGQSITPPPLELPAGNTAQSAGSAITYARRYAALAVLGLATEDDDGASSRPPPPPPRREFDLAAFVKACDQAGVDEYEVMYVAGIPAGVDLGDLTVEHRPALLTALAELKDAHGGHQGSGGGSVAASPAPQPDPAATDTEGEDGE